MGLQGLQIASQSLPLSAPLQSISAIKTTNHTAITNVARIREYLPRMKSRSRSCYTKGSFLMLKYLVITPYVVSLKETPRIK